MTDILFAEMISSGGDRVNIDCASFIVYGGYVGGKSIN
jgi:hypothetical protein